MPPLETVTPLTVAPNSTISVPPALTKLVLAVPPDSTSNMPPPLTVVLVSAAPLATSIAPPLTFQWAVLAPVTVQVPPTTLKVVKPRYCAVAPMELRSNVSEPVPPSWKVLLPESGSTMPLMTIAGAEGERVAAAGEFDRSAAAADDRAGIEDAD